MVGAGFARVAPVEIQKSARIENRIKVSSHSFICERMTIENEAPIGYGVMFIKDKYPRGTIGTGQLQAQADWTVKSALIKHEASIGRKLLFCAA